MLSIGILRSSLIDKLVGITVKRLHFFRDKFTILIGIYYRSTQCHTIIIVNRCGILGRFPSFIVLKIPMLGQGLLPVCPYIIDIFLYCIKGRIVLKCIVCFAFFSVFVGKSKLVCYL